MSDLRKALDALMLAETRLIKIQGLLANAVHNLREAHARVACAEEEQDDE